MIEKIEELRDLKSRIDYLRESLLSLGAKLDLAVASIKKIQLPTVALIDAPPPPPLNFDSAFSRLELAERAFCGLDLSVDRFLEVSRILSELR